MDFDGSMAPSDPPPTILARQTVPLNIQSDAPKRSVKKLTTDQIIAIVLMFFLLVGVIVMTLALTGVFNRTPDPINLTPSIVPPVSLTPIILVN